MSALPATVQLRKSPVTLGAMGASCLVSATIAPALLWVSDFASTGRLTTVLMYLLAAALGGFLGALSVWDTLTRRIPNQLLLVLGSLVAPIVLTWTFSTEGWATLGLSALIAAAWFVVTLSYTVFKPEAFGGGDLKTMPIIMLPLGLFALWVPVLWAVCSLLFSSVHALNLRTRGVRAVPFAPSMNVALPVSLGVFALIQGSFAAIPG
ncbi:prepilin peptidase [Glutamicibacter arilaitensis]|uniref:prepilin peptidase n=1 Tax=Glutamicibacter arilaitensis TaxID=256701 RepID=UPI003FCEEE4C